MHEKKWSIPPYIWVVITSTKKMIKSTLHFVAITCCGQMNPQKLCKQAHVYKQQQQHVRMRVNIPIHIRFAICISNLT